MTHHRRPFVTLVRTRLHGCGPISLRNKKKQIPTPSYAYPPSPEAAWPLIRLPPFPPRIVGLPRYAFPRHRPRRATSLHTPLTYVPITCATHLRPSHLRRSLSRCLSVAHRRRTGCRPHHGRWGAHAVAPQVFPDKAKVTNERCRCWWCSRVAARRRIPLQQPKSTGPGLPFPYVVNVC
jgi:hypothetical protein